MYPLKLILIGCSDTTRVEIHREAANHAATVDAEFPDARAAMGRIHPTPEQKPLFIIEVRQSEDILEIEKINNTLIGCPVLALINVNNNFDLVFQAMRAGASQVVPLPIRPHDLENAMSRLLRQFGVLDNESKLIAVCGVSGGTGGTTLAINLAYELAHTQQHSTILLELGQQVGKLAVCLDLKPRFSTHDLLNDISRMDLNLIRDYLYPYDAHLQILAGPYLTSQVQTYPIADVVHMLEYLRRLAHIIVVDIPFAVDDTFYAVMAAADEIVLVTEQKVPSLHSLILARQGLEEKGVMGHQHIVVNRYNSASEINLDYLHKLTNVEKIFTIHNDYSAISEATNKGRPLRVHDAHCTALKDIHNLVQYILSPREPASAKPQEHHKGFWHMAKKLLH